MLTSPKYCCNYDDVMRVLKKQPHSKDLEKITNKANKETMIIEESIKTLVTGTVNLFEEDKPISGYTKKQFTEKVHSIAAHEQIDPIKHDFINIAWQAIPEKFRNSGGASRHEKVPSIIPKN